MPVTDAEVFEDPMTLTHQHANGTTPPAPRIAWLADRPRAITPEQHERFEGYLAEILGSLGLDLQTPGTADTPRRFLDALIDATEGYAGDPKLMTVFPTECYGDASCELAQIVEGPIPFYALCEHHALPFFGKAYVGYVAHDQIIGISKLTRLVRVLTRRFGVQERMTHQIATSLSDLLECPWRGGLPRGRSPVHPDARRARGRRRRRARPRTAACTRRIRRCAASSSRLPASIARHADARPGSVRRPAVAGRAPSPDGPMRGGALPERLRARYGGELAVSLSHRSADGHGQLRLHARRRDVLQHGRCRRRWGDQRVLRAGSLRHGTPALPRRRRADRRGHAARRPRRRMDTRRRPPGTRRRLRGAARVAGSAAESIDGGAQRVGLAGPFASGSHGPERRRPVVTTVAGAALLARQPVPAISRSAWWATAPSSQGPSLDLLGERGAALVLCEGGPRVLGELLAATSCRRALPDDRTAARRAVAAHAAPGSRRGHRVQRGRRTLGRLIGLRRAGDHLFTRYQFR